MHPLARALAGRRARSGEGSQAEAASPTRRQWLVLGTVGAVALAVDQASKAVVRAELTLGEEVRGLGPYGIHHVRNDGLVHGLFPGIASEVAVATVAVIVGLLAWFAVTGGESAATPVAFGLLVGGSVGNLVDRARLGYVTDFIDPDRGGTFNLADVAIMVGLGLLVLGSFFGQRRRPCPAGTGGTG